MSKATALYLIVDGAGSAAAYIHLPSLPSGGNIYALESPFFSDPTEFTCSIEAVAGLYHTALRKTQPEGPYPPWRMVFRWRLRIRGITPATESRRNSAEFHHNRHESSKANAR
ncbi:hypothetical protein N7G274_001574 [Stereocaulon virgatum]|uniref:Uncharacterized protein n=1 Tax=Stereocaulon virgatum TaxID=373712 RepID=A0ABR4AN37_9LECA